MLIRVHHWRKSERGQALVEFALVLPILLLLILGIVDFGICFYSLVTVNTAAREGARQGILASSDVATVEAAIERLTDLLPGGGDVEIKLNGTSIAGVTVLPGSGENLHVLVTYTYDLITPLPSFSGITSPVTLTGQITMVRE